MNIGIIYPGSNCDLETYNYFLYDENNKSIKIMYFIFGTKMKNLRKSWIY